MWYLLWDEEKECLGIVQDNMGYLVDTKEGESWPGEKKNEGKQMNK